MSSKLSKYVVVISFDHPDGAWPYKGYFVTNSEYGPEYTWRAPRAQLFSMSEAIDEARARSEYNGRSHEIQQAGARHLDEF